LGKLQGGNTHLSTRSVDVLRGDESTIEVVCATAADEKRSATQDHCWAQKKRSREDAMIRPATEEASVDIGREGEGKGILLWAKRMKTTGHQSKRRESVGGLTRIVVSGHCKNRYSGVARNDPARHGEKSKEDWRRKQGKE